MNNIIFHGGCVGCITQSIKGKRECTKCMYFDPNWSLPNLSKYNKEKPKMKILTIEGKDVNIPEEWYESIKKQMEEPKKPNYHDVYDILSPQYSPNITNCTSRKQCEKLEAINRMMNVAKFLNKDWKPDWKDHCREKLHFAIDHNEVIVTASRMWNKSFVYFKTEELAKEAISILGEDTIKLALSTDW